MLRVKPENRHAKNSLPHPKKICWGKTSNFAELLPTHRQKEQSNFEMAQHIDKQITYVSSTINVLKHDTKLGGITTWGFDAT